MIKVYCKYPQCNKTFSTSDGARKHAKKKHIDWISNMKSKKKSILNYCGYIDNCTDNNNERNIYFDIDQFDKNAIDIKESNENNYLDNNIQIYQNYNINMINIMYYLGYFNNIQSNLNTPNLCNVNENINIDFFCREQLNEYDMIDDNFNFEVDLIYEYYRLDLFMKYLNDSIFS